MIIDVSGFRFNCGLFSLALAVSIELQRQNRHCPHIPPFVQSLFRSDVSKTRELTDLTGLRELATQLRSELYESMRQHQVYKSSRFLAVFADWYQNKREPEQEIFHTTPEILQIKDQILAARAQDLTGIGNEEKLEAGTIAVGAMLEVAPLRQALESFMSQPNLQHSAVYHFLEQQNQATSVDDFLRFGDQLYKAWDTYNYQGIAAENRSLLAEVATYWYYTKASEFLKNSPEPEYNMNLRTLARAGVNFRLSNDLKENIEALSLYYHMYEHWDRIYNYYLEAIRDTSVFLSTVEINCLAEYWGVHLWVSNDGEERDQSITSSGRRAIEVTLCNLSRVHWTVCLPKRVYSDVEIQATNTLRSAPAIVPERSVQKSLPRTNLSKPI